MNTTTTQELNEWRESGHYDNIDNRGHMAYSPMSIDTWKEMSEDKRKAYDEGYYGSRR